MYYSKKTRDSSPYYGCHFEHHLKNFTTLKNENNMPVKFSKYNRKLLDIVTNCKFDFRLSFALNGGHLGHYLHYFNLVNQTCECFILTVYIIRPLNIDKNSKLKCFVASFFSELDLRNLIDSHLGRYLKMSTF